MKWIIFILLMIINLDILLKITYSRQLNKKSNIQLRDFTETTTTQTLPQTVMENSEFCTNLTEDKDIIMDLFEEIEISVLCDYLKNEVSAKKLILLNISVSDSTLYVRVRLHIEKGDCTNQTIFTKWVNYSVGLGVNKLRYTVDSFIYKQLHLNEVYEKVEQTNYTVVSSMKSVNFNIIRSLPNILIDKYLLKVCIMEQNCLHWIDRSRPCGLQDVRNIFRPKDYPLISGWNESGGWSLFQSFIETLSDGNCSPSRNKNGKGLQIIHSAWFIPCKSCNHTSNETNCDWSNALWYEPNDPIYPCLYNTRSIQNDKSLITTYVRNRVLLFLGDSTLRGLMYSLLYRVNKTLSHVQETHGQITLINSATITTRFTYFPDYSIKSQFNNKNKINSFNSLLKSLFTFNQTFNEALLFVGGVRWLNSYHLKAIQVFIDKQKVFRSVKVYIKDYSAGFHTPVDGLPFVNWSRRMNEHRRNQELIRLINEYNWSIISTHQITWTRLNHFHAYARCSCHFYHVIKQNAQSNVAINKYQHTINNNGKDHNTFVYHIIGQIQWIMSRIVETTIINNIY
ncbi:unnamed protein product [Schistosoma mattheei]|uniref:Cadherin domain-containing protein n=1 Tax=Schistosoma mattheei TaxID=31246 RepID=A0AA85BLB1_9TREM|nr:unnamed protein product [Schistosoma mattheei]